MRLHVVVGNRKLGSQVHNVSLMPRQTCRADVPCAKPGQCYALRFLGRKNVRRAWLENTKLALSEPYYYWKLLGEHVAHADPKWFRFHVAGDFPSQGYVKGAFDLARQFPGTNFLAFTKRFEFSYSHRPRNFSLVFSAWPGMVVPRGRFPIAWMDDGTDGRIPKDALRCPGGCEGCMACWGLAQRGIDVVFSKH